MKIPKYLFLALFLLPHTSTAQVAGNTDSLALSMLSDLRETWTVGVDSNSNSVDIGMYNRYKALFHADALVDDDLNIRFMPGRDSGHYLIDATPKDFDLYAHDAALRVNKFRVDSVGTPLRISAGDSLVYEITRTVYVEEQAHYLFDHPDLTAQVILAAHPAIRFEKSGRLDADAQRAEILEMLRSHLQRDPDSLYRFTATTTMRITLAEDPEAGLRIFSIRNMRSTIRCTNDADADGILDAADVLPAKPGQFTASGGPDADLDGVPDALDRCSGTYGHADNYGCPEAYFVTNRQIGGAVGIQANLARIGLPQLNTLGYRDEAGNAAIDVLQSAQGALKPVTAVPGIYASGFMTWYFGKTAKRLGVTVGAGYSRYVMRYELEQPIVYTYKAFDGHDHYRRRITISSLEEQIACNIVSLPLQLSYRWKFRNLNRWAFKVNAGPTLMLLSGTSNYRTTSDIGGLYQVDTVRQDRIAYYDYYRQGSKWNVELTAAGINSQNADPGAAHVFHQLDHDGNYDFSAERESREITKISRITYAVSASVEGEYKRSKDIPIALRFGAHFSYAPSTGSRREYMPKERSTDAHRSIFNSNGRSTYLAYGIMFGLSYDF